MDIGTSQAEDAGRLVAVALTRTRPMDPAHRELLRRYRTDGTFRGIVDAFASGLGLRVLDALDTGLVLAADADSPFAFRLNDFRQNLSAEDRLCHGMVQIGIAAWCFPTAASLEDDDRGLVSITVTDVVEHLRMACTELQRRATIDPDLARPELQEAWRIVLSRPETRDTPDGRRAAMPLSGMVGDSRRKACSARTATSEGVAGSYARRTASRCESLQPTRRSGSSPRSDGRADGPIAPCSLRLNRPC
jgi:hypothetical protein